jgi:hypothetical protein
VGSVSSQQGTPTTASPHPAGPASQGEQQQAPQIWAASAREGAAAKSAATAKTTMLPRRIMQILYQARRAASNPPPVFCFRDPVRRT